MIKLFVLFFLISILVIPTQVYADSASTGWEDFRKSPPEDVEVNCKLVITEANDMSLECEFENDNDHPVKFIFCTMIDLSQDAKDDASSTDVSGLTKKNYVLKPDPANPDKWICEEEAGPPKGSDTSVHFGCKLVEIPAGKTVKVKFDSPGKIKLPPGVSVAANDFEVSYADVIDFTGTTKEFDEASCKDAVGQGDFLTPGTSPSAWWYLQNEPFDDPFIMTQSVTGEKGDIQYATFREMRCLPQDFSMTVVQIPFCPPHLGVPPPLTVDINLFYWFSEIQPLGTVLPGILFVETAGDMTEIRVETEPKEEEVFKMLGSEMVFGKLTLCSSENQEECLPPDVEEGRRVTVWIDVLNPETGEFLFSQQGNFIKDTIPPEVDSHTIEFSEDGLLQITLAAHDKTTSPIYSSFWYSIDNGQTWNSITLEPTTDILDEKPARTFKGSIESPDPETVITYFMTVHDLVYNVNYFGVGVTAIPSAGAEEAEGIMVSIETGSAGQGDMMTIDVAFTTADGDATEHVNYDIIATQGSEVVLDEKGVYDHDGQMTHTTSALPLAASTEMPVDVTVTFNGFGIDPPFTGPVGEVATKQIVPEFGTIAMMILGVAIVSIIALSTKSRVIPKL